MLKMHEHETAVKLVSGGIDSYIMSEEIKGLNLYVDYGQRYAREEMAALDRLGVVYETIKIKGNQNRLGEEIYIADRNLLLACIAEMYYKADLIYMAGLLDDNCADKTEAEFERMSEIVSRYALKPVKLISPYWKKTKGDIIAEYEGSKENLINTFSCYAPNSNGEPCGDCPACLRRTIALETNGIKSNVQLTDRVIIEYMKKIHTYDADRISRFFIFLMQTGKKIYAVDIDGVICEENAENDYSRKKKKEIEMQTLHDGYIILYTARLERDRKKTEQWLQENEIEYDALIMNKLPYSTIIDDRSRTNI